MSERNVLLNPGPVTLSERVRQSLLRGDWCHREIEFAELTQSINARLAAVYSHSAGGESDNGASDYESVMLTGSGTAAVEAMLGGFAPDDRETLVVANGVYGERIARILEHQRKPVQRVVSGWLEPMNLAEVKRCLESNPNLSHIVAVHHETTSGRLNELGELAQMAEAAGCQLLIDAVSSFAAESIDFSAWPVAALAATANKCLHAVPGICFVLARRELWRSPPKTPRSLYLDPFAYHEAQHADGFSPFTQSVQAAFALDEALSELADEGGWRARRDVYRARADRIAGELSTLGIRPLLEPAERSCVLTAYRLPAGASYQQLHARLKQERFVIYAGQGSFASEIFRIANMGDLRDADLERFFDCFRRALA